MSTDYYVYGLFDPRTNLPFYIGKGRAARWKVHFAEKRVRTDSYKKYCYIQGLRNKGLEPTVAYFFGQLTQEDAFSKETALIVEYGRKDIDEGGILVNICLDAKPPRNTRKGYKHTEETKARWSAQRKGRQGLKGEANPNFGKSGTMKGRKHSPESIAKMKMLKSASPSMLGKNHSADTKIKMSESAKARFTS